MNRLLAFLLAFLRLGAGEADPPEPEAEPAADPATTEEPDLFALSPDPEPDVPRETSEPQRPDRTAQLEQELREERDARIRLEGRLTQPAPVQGRDPDAEREEAEIAEARRRGMSENDIGWLKFRNDTNRANRETRRAAETALSQARDMADLTAFNQLAVTKPALHKRYATRVEQAIAAMRQRGDAIPPREALMTFLAGQDVLNNTGKTAPKPAAQPVDRGRMPQTRTDVSGRVTASERTKRRERLKGVNI